jgi:hypothetical protein
MMPTCETCRFWLEPKIRQGRQLLAGQCRRDAPALGPAATFDRPANALWPSTYFSDWCGEHERRAAKTPSQATRDYNDAAELASLGFIRRSDYHWTQRFPAGAFSVWPATKKWKWKEQVYQGTWENFLHDLDAARKEPGKDA